MPLLGLLGGLLVALAVILSALRLTRAFDLPVTTPAGIGLCGAVLLGLYLLAGRRR